MNDTITPIVAALADLALFVASCIIGAVTVLVFRRGNLRHSPTTYPRLWVLGGSMAFCGGVCRFLAVFINLGGEWAGPFLAASKIVTALFAGAFAFEYWRVREELVLIGRLLERVQELEKEQP